MSWRLSVLALVSIAIGCSDSTGPTPRPALQSNLSALPVDHSIKIRAVPDLEGNNVFATGFNRRDVVTGYITTGSTRRVFRAHRSVDYFAPPSSFQPGNFFSIHAGINDRGAVAGGIINDTAQRAYIWSRAGSTTLLPPTFAFDPGEGALGCGAWAINDSGYVVGTCMPNVNWFETEWRPDGTISKLTCCGVLTAISENQYLTGYDLTFDPPIALLWPPGAPYYTLIGMEGNQLEESAGLAVNDKGWVVGWAVVNDADTAALLWVPGQPQRILSHLGQATGIDVTGNIVGFHRETQTSPRIAFLWNSETGAHFLPGLPDGGETAAVAINSMHEILGWAIDAQGLKHTVIWRFPR